MIYNENQLDTKIKELDELLDQILNLNEINENAIKLEALSQEILDYETIHESWGEPIEIENDNQYEIACRAIEYPNILKVDVDFIKNVLNALDKYEGVKVARL